MYSSCSIHAIFRYNIYLEVRYLSSDIQIRYVSSCSVPNFSFLERIKWYIFLYFPYFKFNEDLFLPQKMFSEIYVRQKLSWFLYADRWLMRLQKQSHGFPIKIFVFMALDYSRCEPHHDLGWKFFICKGNDSHAHMLRYFCIYSDISRRKQSFYGVLLLVSFYI